MVDRCTSAQNQVLGRQVADQLSVPIVLHVGPCSNLADQGAVNIPLAKNGFHLSLAALLNHYEHALLRFRQKNFPGMHARLAGRNPVKMNPHAHLATCAHFGGRAGDARGTHVLHAHHGAGLGQLHGGLKKQLLLKGVAYLNRGYVVGGIFAQVFGCKGGSVDAVAARRRTDNVDGVAHPARLGADLLAHFNDSGRECIHQRILLVAVVKIDFAADGRNTKAVAVVANAFDHAVDQPFGAVGAGIAEPQRVQLRNGPSAHGENIAVDSAHSRRSTLVGLHGRRVVVRLNFKGTG